MKDFCYPGTEFKSEYIEVSAQVRLKLITFSPPDNKKGTNHPAPPADADGTASEEIFLPVIFLPGLGSIIDNFRGTLTGLTRNHTVLFLDTREKESSEISGRVGFSIKDIASDLPVVIEKLGLPAGGYIICGYSLGSAVAVSALKHIRNKPMAVVLTEPSATFKWPWWLPPLARVAVPFYGAIKPFLKWYMKKFRINTADDYEMYEINARILDRADPRKLAATVVAIAGYEMWGDLKSIEIPALVIGVSKDKFHSHDEASDIAAGIKDCTYVDVETNTRSHSPEVADIISGFLKNTKKAQKQRVTSMGIDQR